jgi:N-carbamoyl-L-amino-acid hydrolase
MSSFRGGWTNQAQIREGARFTPGCSGSAVWAAHTPLAQAHNLFDNASTCTIATELQRIGYFGSVPANYEQNPLSAHFELHIEQRKMLQDKNKQIGTVINIQGIRWYRVTVEGQRAHAGSTPMADRADALAIAAKIMVMLESRAIEVSAVATVGVVELERPSSNTIPGFAMFSVDLRHPSEAALTEFEASVQEYMNSLMAANGKLKCRMVRIWRSPAVTLDAMATACTRRAATRVVGSHDVVDMISYAGHDSALTATKIPTSMIFVPSKDGISHAPEEFTSEAEWYVSYIS